ncbi:MAG: trigger factor [Deltaproteobacteria bacterium]|jgi:trigger factor|nr:trigger factor [Deltaproteobacteria bacterium]
MTTEQTQKSAVRVETIERTSILHTIEVEVDVSRVRKAFDRAYRDLAKQVRVKGFRPGKAPRSVLERLHGASVAEQLEHTLVSETLADAIELAEIQPVSEPAISAGKPAPDASFKYTASIEVSPEIELPDLSGLPAVRPEVSVEDAEVEQRLEELRNANAPLVEEPEGTALARGHTATIDFVGRIDEDTFEGGTGQGVPLEIGGGRFIPGFEDQLIGAQAGDDRDVTVTFPEAYGNPEVAGKEAVFAVHIVDIRKAQIPQLDDEFAKDLGDFDSLEALRARIRSDLEAGQERESKETFRTTLMDALLERMDFNVPPGMIDRQLQNQLASAHQRLEGQLDHEAIHAQLDRWREEWRPRAERDVREMLALQAIAKAQQIEISDDEVAAKIDELMGGGDEQNPRLRQMHEDEQLKGALRHQLRDEKVLDFLVSAAKIDESSGT